MNKHLFYIESRSTGNTRNGTTSLNIYPQHAETLEEAEKLAAESMEYTKNPKSLPIDETGRPNTNPEVFIYQLIKIVNTTK